MHSSRYFYLIDNLGDNLLAGDVRCLSLVGQSDTMAKHIMSNGTHIFRHHIAATLDECVGTGSLGQVDAGTW